jgi:hypothetical protein
MIDRAYLPFFCDLDPTAELVNFHRLDAKRLSDLACNTLAWNGTSRLDQKDGTGRNRCLPGKLPYAQ